MDGFMIVMVAGGLLVTVLTVGGSIWGVAKIFGGMSKDSAERDRLLREGIQAGARLVSVQAGGMSMSVGGHRHLQLQLQIEVHAPGRPPYPAMLTTMVSELQIPQLQPGAQLTVRIDRNDPMKVALEGAGGPPPQYGGAPMPGMYGAAPAAFGAPPGYGAPAYGGGYGGGYAGPGAPPGYRAPDAYGGQGMVPIGAPPTVPAGAKLGLWIGLGAGLVGVIVAIVVVVVNVGGAGLDSASEGSGVCAQAIRCCEVVAAGNASAANCKNMGKLGVPTQVCESTLKSMSDAAQAQGKTCR